MLDLTITRAPASTSRSPFAISTKLDYSYWCSALSVCVLSRNNEYGVVHEAAAQRASGSMTGTPVNLSKAVSMVNHRLQPSFSEG